MYVNVHKLNLSNNDDTTIVGVKHQSIK